MGHDCDATTRAALERRGYRIAESTPVAERVYADLGFRDLGRYFEYVPR